MMYQIADWNKHFENNRTRQLKRLSWVPMPNKQDGDGYTEIIDHPDGAAHYGCWCAILGVASKCQPRGTLVRDGDRPHDLASLSRMTRIPEEILKVAIERLINIGWLTVSDNPAPKCKNPAPECGKVTMEGNGMEGNGREWKGGGGGEPPAPPPPGILELVDQVRKCRPEFEVLNQMALENALRGIPIKDAQKAVSDFCRKEANKLQATNDPISLLAGFLRKAYDAAQPPKQRSRLT